MFGWIYGMFLEKEKHYIIEEETTKYTALTHGNKSLYFEMKACENAIP